jgi:hypothetical protein
MFVVAVELLLLGLVSDVVELTVAVFDSGDGVCALVNAASVMVSVSPLVSDPRSHVIVPLEITQLPLVSVTFQLAV